MSGWLSNEAQEVSVSSSEVYQSPAQEPVKESEKAAVAAKEGMVGRLSRSYTEAYALAKEKVVAILVVAQTQVDLAKTFVTDSFTYVKDSAQVAKTSVEERVTQLRTGVKAGYDTTLERADQVKTYIFSTYESATAKASAVKGAAVERYEVVKTKAMEGVELAKWTYQNPKEAATNVQTVAYDGAKQVWDGVTSRVEEVATSARTTAGQAVETSKWVVMNPREATNASIAAAKEGLVKVQTSAADARDKAFETYANCKTWTYETYESSKERAVQTYATAKEIAITKKNEAVETVSHAVEVTSTKVVEVSQSTKVAVMDPKNQATAASAVAGGAAMGATGGAAGFVAGGTAGAVVGVVPALFTFGLSIPIGAAIGAGVGTTVGAVGGGAVGAVSGGMAGREVYERRGDIKSSASSTWSKACEYTEVVKSSATERITQVRQRLYKPAATSEPAPETAAAQ